MSRAGQLLDSLAVQYRAFLAARGENSPELELRFPRLDFETFESIHRQVAGGALGASGSEAEFTINAIMSEGRRRRGARGSDLVRQLNFKGRHRLRGRDRYYRKNPLEGPVAVRNPHALDYLVVVSNEEPIEPFMSDETALLRVKKRASFCIEVARGEATTPWRLDMTITRQLEGGQAEAHLERVRDEMFGAPQAAERILEGIAEAPVYRYEVEVEHLPREGAAPLAGADIEAAAAAILGLANPAYLSEAAAQREVFALATYLVDNAARRARFEFDLGLKQLLPQVTALTREEYSEVYPPTGYYLLDKADGVRAIAVLREENGLRAATIVAAGRLARHGEGGAGEPLAILDGELVGAELGVGTLAGGTFYAFDVMHVNPAALGLGGADAGPGRVSQRGYGDRLRLVAPAVAALRAVGVAAEAKPVVHLTAEAPADLRPQFEDARLRERPYETDGLILVEPGKSYQATRAWKHKPPALTTIDFLLRAADARPARGPKTATARYLLFVGISPELFRRLGLARVEGYETLFPHIRRDTAYMPVQFSPSDAPRAYECELPAGALGEESLDGRVVELRPLPDGKTGGVVAADGTVAWEALRVRTDRDREVAGGTFFGNDFRVAELTLRAVIDPFPDSALWDGPDFGYFAGRDNSAYAAQRAFTSFVKTRRIAAEAAHADWVVDLGVGRGQDLRRYFDAGVRHLVGVDASREALTTLVRRKYDLARRRGATHSTSVAVVEADLARPAAETAGRIRGVVGFPDAGARLAVCNLAVHYFAGSVGALRNFAALCRRLVAPGGRVVVTYLRGDAVHAAFAAAGVPQGGSYDLREGEALKYSFRRDYASDELTEAGQRIGVLLPFSAGEYYAEFLLNFAGLASAMGFEGFAVRENHPFAEFERDFRLRNAQKDRELSEQDREFLRLYATATFERAADGAAVAYVPPLVCEIMGERRAGVLPSTCEMLEAFAAEEEARGGEPRALPRVLADLPAGSPYDKRGEMIHAVLHYGQRKLHLNEVSFLTRYGHLAKRVVYPGAASGQHIAFLSELFPEHSFDLYDLAEFTVKPTERIRIHAAYYTTDDVRKDAEDPAGFLLISDIRTGLEAAEAGDRAPVDMALQAEWVTHGRPRATQLKFRVPWEGDSTPYFAGELRLQPWAPRQTNETRLEFEGVPEMVDYPHQAYDHSLFWLNEAARKYGHFGPPCGAAGHDGCFDCQLEAAIWAEYLERFGGALPPGVPGTVKDLVDATTRRLRQPLAAPPHGLEPDVPMWQKRPRLVAAVAAGEIPADAQAGLRERKARIFKKKRAEVEELAKKK